MSNFSPPNRLLFGPGPSQVAPRVYEAMTKPIVGHLDPFFFEVYEDVRNGLRAVFGTQNSFVQVISGTGSAGMEASVANFVGPGQKLAVFVGGFFAGRIAEMGERHGATVVRFDMPLGEAATEAQATEFLNKERPDVVAFVHAETSTGVLQDPLAITRPAHALGALTISDCVTSIGALPINVNAAGIDVAFGCTQKGLSCPPGLSPITLSDAAVEHLRARTKPSSVWYMDLKLLLEYYEGAHRYHHTAPITSFYALREGLALVCEEGVQNRFDRHVKMHQEFVRRIEAAGFRMFVTDPARRITTINAIHVPDGVDPVKSRKALVDKYGIDIGGGYASLANKIFRVGLMGPLATPENVDMLVGAMVDCIK
jgi:alanine-glyoxylate transaminase/serine-glyoxylate transaminase/serine-pyruvate transaminase